MLTTTSIRAPYRPAARRRSGPPEERGPDRRDRHVAVEQPDPRDEVEPAEERRALRALGDVRGEGCLELGPVAGQPAPDDDDLGPGHDEHLDGERDAVRQRRDDPHRPLVAVGRGREEVGGGPGPQAVQGGARRDRLEAPLLPARARDAGADGDVPDLAGRAAGAPHDLAPVDDRGSETGADVEVGRRAPVHLGAQRVVGAEGGRLDVVVDDRTTTGRGLEAAGEVERLNREVDRVPGPAGGGVDEPGHARADVLDGRPAADEGRGPLGDVDRGVEHLGVPATRRGRDVGDDLARCVEDERGGLRAADVDAEPHGRTTSPRSTASRARATTGDAP